LRPLQRVRQPRNRRRTDIGTGLDRKLANLLRVSGVDHPGPAFD